MSRDDRTDPAHDVPDVPDVPDAQDSPHAPETDEVHEDEPPLSPEESLRLIEQGRNDAIRRLDGDPLLFYLPWGISWLIGYGLLFLRFGPDGRIFVPMPEWVPLFVLFVLMSIAMVLTGWAGYRAHRDISGESSVRGLYYGLSWFVGFAGLMSVIGRISEHLSEPDRYLLYGAGAITLVGTLYVAGAAVWRDRTMFGYGIWVSAVNVVGVILGSGWHALVIALAGGGGLIVLGFASRIRMIRKSA